MNVKIIKSMKNLYESGKRTKEEFAQRVVNGILTETEYQTITGEVYKV